MGKFSFLHRLFLGILACLLLVTLTNPVSSGQDNDVTLIPGDLIVADPAIHNGCLWKVDPLTGDKHVISSGGLVEALLFVVVRYGSDGIVSDFFVSCVRTLPTPPIGRIVRVDPLTGSQSLVASGGFIVEPRHMAIDCGGDLLVADSGYDAIIKIDPETGNQSVIASGFMGPYGLAIEQDGNLIVADGGLGAVFRVDPSDGSMSILSSGPFDWNPIAVALDANGDIILTEGRYYTIGTVSKIDKITGERTVISSGGFLCVPHGVDVEADGNIVVADYRSNPYPPNHCRIIRINPTNGAQSLITTCPLGHGIKVIKPPPFIDVQIDIKPGSDPNTINLGSNGNVPVAIFSTSCFDASTIDPLSVTLAGTSVRLKGKGTPMVSAEDVNEDGLMDLIVHVDTIGLQLSLGDSEAVLEGKTYGGLEIRGRDSVRIIE